MFESRQSLVNQIRRWRLTAPTVLARVLAATLFPPRCCLCGFPGVSVDLDLCGYCHGDLPWNRDAQDAPDFLVPLRYESPIDEMIRQLKYHGALEHARVLGVLLAAAVRARAAPLPRLLLPVPLHDARLRERGFNQAFVLARYAGRLLEVPYARTLLRRVRDSPSQTALDVSARRANVRGVFAVSGARAHSRLVAAEHVAIVDDVLTTGSTVAELRSLLLGAGVRTVEVWAVARAL